METRNTRRSLHLPEEIMEEILSRLAVKSLLRFRCVLKSWRSLIDSERFIKTHLQNSLKNTAFSHHRLIPDNCLTSFDDRASLPWKSVCIVGCCNGLVCCSNLKQGRFFLWNPATKIAKELPELVIENGDWLLPTYGFGWDELSGAYKVFVVLRSRRECMGKVYSSNTNSWKTVERCDFFGVRDKGHFVSGKLHWLGKKNNEIVTFDLKKEEFGVMKLPCDSIFVSLGVNEGRLTMISFENTRAQFDDFDVCVMGQDYWDSCENTGALFDDFDVWVMEQDSWVKATDVVVYEPCEIILLVARFCTSHHYAGIGLIWGWALKVLRESIFKLYDDVRSGKKKIEAYLPTHVYVESLVSPVPHQEPLLTDSIAGYSLSE